MDSVVKNRIEEIRKRLEAFWQRVAVRSKNECWNWQGPKDKRGYGYFDLNGTRHRAHRAAWILTFGTKPPKNIFVCHRCDNPSCVNVAHLFLGTCADNMQDASKKGRLKRDNHYHHNRDRKFCAAGHPLSGSNVHRYKRKRICIACRTRNNLRWTAITKAKRKEAK
jgi:hypothetical protein